nr:hypothetical protein [uncultured Blautia sp.]
MEWRCGLLKGGVSLLFFGYREAGGGGGGGEIGVSGALRLSGI